MRRIRDIKYPVCRFRAELPDSFRQNILTSARDDDTRACLHKALGHRKAQAGSADGDQRQLPLKAECLLKRIDHDDLLHFAAQSMPSIWKAARI